jgi:hypothetical protein
LYDKLLGQFAIGESGQSQHARRVGCRRIAAELICEVVEESLRLTLIESLHFPYDLVLAGRGIENEVRCRDFG